MFVKLLLAQRERNKVKGDAHKHKLTTSTCVTQSILFPFFSLFLFLYMVAPCAPNEKCYKLTTRANDLFERHLYAEALIEYTKALKCATETGSCDDDYLALIYANRSATCLQVGDCQQAKEDAARAIALAKRWGKVIDNK